MKNFIFVFALLAIVTLGFSNQTASAASCGEIDPVTSEMVQCGNGMIATQAPGGRYLKAGQEDCPSWFPSSFGYACYTMRVFGAPFTF